MRNLVLLIVVAAIIGIAGCVSIHSTQESQQVRCEKMQHIYDKAQLVVEKSGEESSEGELMYEGELYIELFVGPDSVSSLTIDYKGHEVFGAFRKPYALVEARAYVPGKWETVLEKL